MKEVVLELENVTMQFGGVVAVDSLNMYINEGEIVALIGPNGAGKTTAFNVITGVYAPTNGCVRLRGKTIAQGHPTGKMRKLYAGTHIGDYDRLVSNTPDAITEMGVARTFQNIRLFKNMTVLENVLVARHMRLKSGLITSTLHLNLQEERRIRRESMDLLEMLGMADLAHENAASLPYGRQRYLEIVRALATEPRLLLLDEPAAGMNPQETEDLCDFIRDIKERFKLTVFLIEHHMNLVMDISDRIYVLDFGKRIAEGTPQEIQDDPAVIAAYLGVDEE
ncbi:MAG TPA: ABC transporter ATP-binding protein [Candidatus Limiplasma stercoravium]|nr:ABC transporter ATP-binding protein [Candidatus Limiplasma stercoravium]